MEGLLRFLAPFLLLLGILLVVSGGALALIFGRIAYQMLYTPQDIPILTFVLGHVPANIATSSLKGTVGSQSFEVLMPEALTIYGFTFLVFIGFGLLLAV